MKLYEKTLTQKRVFTGHLINVRQDVVELPEGREAGREVIEHPGGVCVAAQLDSGEFIVVDQYRYGVKAQSTEFPAGKLELNEDPEQAILRELEEETGYITHHLVPMGYLDPSPAYLSERIYLYYADHLEYKGQHLDEGELLNVRHESLTALHQQILENTLHDAKTIALVLKVKALLSQ